MISFFTKYVECAIIKENTPCNFIFQHNRKQMLFSVDDYVIGAYSPLQATLLSFLLSWACCVWLGLLTYFFNYVTEGYTGTFISAGFVLMDITVANEWLPWFYKISPVTLAQLQALKGNNSLYQVDLCYALWFFGVSIVCLLVGCIIAPKFYGFRRKRK